MLQILLGDGVLIYRCFVIYGHSWLVIAFPSLLFLGTATCGFVVPVVEATWSGSNAKVKASYAWTDATTVLTLCTNLLTTSRFIYIVLSFPVPIPWLRLGLIVARLYLVSRRSASITSQTNGVSNGQPVRYAMRIVIESGVIYTISTIVLAAVSYRVFLCIPRH
jgi:hypothetical protein